LKSWLRKSFQYADIVKLNEHELIQVSFLFHLGAGTAEVIARRLLQTCDLKLVCITRADRGSLLVSREQTVEHGGFQVKVADAVGAGDAFTACLAHHYVGGNPLQQISEAANRFASWVATQRGATPPITSSQLQEILNGGLLFSKEGRRVQDRCMKFRFRDHFHAPRRTSALVTEWSQNWGPLCKVKLLKNDGDKTVVLKRLASAVQLRP
jgi:bifunctional ADP-heptose synthase (sugar kinase/adenylyltransferase)